MGEYDEFVEEGAAPLERGTLVSADAVTAEDLKAGSPKPFTGRPDPDYPELDSLEPLYLPRFLFRSWGSERFFRSGYYAHWMHESRRPERTLKQAGFPDVKK